MKFYRILIMIILIIFITIPVYSFERIKTINTGTRSIWSMDIDEDYIYAATRTKDALIIDKNNYNIIKRIRSTRYNIRGIASSGDYFIIGTRGDVKVYKKDTLSFCKKMSASSAR